MGSISISTEIWYVWIFILIMKNFFVVLLTSITISVVAVSVYVVSISLWGKAMYFGYVRLFFILSIVGGGVLSAYFIYINNSNFFYSILHGIITSLSIFFLIGFAIVNIYGA
ncbi:Uncharacterised protein [Citrobacter amalonaticus]|uniref:Uncharacterized protein n=1 Tax=Citrobacter amalonaticus TaxID=35703 RepID=A0A6N2TAM3_CITAM